MADIIIDLAAEFTGKNAFNKAESATDNLTKHVKKLAKTLGVAYSAQQVLAFGKASVKAAAEDQKAQQQLALALKNVGLGRDAATSEAYIQRLQSEFGVLDDKLRPAYQTLAIATRDTDEAQKLLNLSLDISASTGKDLSTVTAALSKAYLGNNTSLSKLGVGISKADLKAKSFNDIVSQLSTTFAGSATAAANTFQGSIDKLGVASANVKETIGTGIIDALKLLGKDQNIDTATAKMQQFANATNETLVGLSSILSKIQGNKIGGAILGTFGDVLGNLQPFASFRKEGKAVNAKSAAKFPQGMDNAHLASLVKQSQTTQKILKSNTKLTAEQIKALNASKLKLAIDKANLALGKGSDIFNLDQIQVAAALTNQAEQLAKTTSGAQVLQIANDTARLNVKRSIYNLEQAIASQDEKAVIAATDKLNADLKTLSALTGQETKLVAIKGILDSLSSKSIGIDVDTTAAMAKIKALYDSATAGIVIPVSIGGTADNSLSNLQNIGGIFTGIQSNLKEYTAQLGTLLSGFKQGGGEYNYAITVNTGIGDPNAIAATIQQYIIDAVARGTLKGGAY